MSENFDLSIYNWNEWQTKRLKEFIRLLKDVNENIITERGQFNREYFKIFIDDLVGDKLK